MSRPGIVGSAGIGHGGEEGRLTCAVDIPFQLLDALIDVLVFLVGEGRQEVVILVAEACNSNERGEIRLKLRAQGRHHIVKA